jgi:hypothetical protein
MTYNLECKSHIPDLASEQRGSAEDLTNSGRNNL